MSCTGHCCVAFTMSRSLDELGNAVDGETLRSMLEPITQEEAVERMNRLYPSEGGWAMPDEQLYRCVRWDEETRLCTDYEHRPEMCRSYPAYDTGRECPYGCGCTDGRVDLVEMAEAA